MRSSLGAQHGYRNYMRTSLGAQHGYRNYMRSSFSHCVLSMAIGIIWEAHSHNGQWAHSRSAWLTLKPRSFESLAKRSTHRVISLSTAGAHKTRLALASKSSTVLISTRFVAKVGTNRCHANQVAHSQFPGRSPVCEDTIASFRHPLPFGQWGSSPYPCTGAYS